LIKTDYLIIGSGIAGLALALKLAQLGEVTIVTKKGISAGSTGLAQGGIAGVRNLENDTFENHFKDTLKAGGYLNDPQAVRYLVEMAPQALESLEKYGVKFDFSLHLEGGHSRPRISHVADETGRAVQEILTDVVRAKEQIRVLENHFAVDLLTLDQVIFGARVFDQAKNYNILASKTIIATGGAGQIFAKTTNPTVATGDGIAMARRSGASLSDLEFIQFHPTAFDYPKSPLFLLSEALRGAGAKLVNQDEQRFCDELAPRDEVARAIFSQKKAYLDFRHEKASKLQSEFPNIWENLQRSGFNLAQDLIPITPAEHFFCGGIKVDLAGQTNLANLYALGETAFTGVHGANRLASNSLLEAVVFAESIYGKLQNENLTLKNFPPNLTAPDFVADTAEDLKLRQTIKELMWHNVGLVRRRTDLAKTLINLNKLQTTGTEASNLLLVAREVTKAALRRQESIGGHFLVT
jgi:L-aspartate oxidase